MRSAGGAHCCRRERAHSAETHRGTRLSETKIKGVIFSRHFLLTLFLFPIVLFVACGLQAKRVSDEIEAKRVAAADKKAAADAAKRAADETEAKRVADEKAAVEANRVAAADKKAAVAAKCAADEIEAKRVAAADEKAAIMSTLAAAAESSLAVRKCAKVLVSLNKKNCRRHFLVIFFLILPFLFSRSSSSSLAACRRSALLG